MTKKRIRSISVKAGIFLALTLTVPRWYCGMEAGDQYADIQAGSLSPNGSDSTEPVPPGSETRSLLRRKTYRTLPLACHVAEVVERGVSTRDFTTGHRRFDGEWQFGTYHMAGIGLAQALKIHPQVREHPRFIAAIERCIEKLLSEEVTFFDSEAWKEDPIASLDGPKGHAAYLGYFNLTLGLYREVAKNPKFNEIHDRITAALVRRLEKNPLLMLETYPREVYPVDNAAVIAGIGQYDRVTGSDHRDLIRRWVENCRRRHVDPKSGLLIQAIDHRDGSALDAPRASGTALAVYFLSFADPAFSAELYGHLRKNCGTDWGGFGLVREYAPGGPQGTGDIDSGPVVLRMSFSGTGFSVAGARIHRDADFFEKLYRTVYLFGAPNDVWDTRNFVTGGPLGNAIMLAMLTAQPAAATTPERKTK